MQAPVPLPIAQAELEAFARLHGYADDPDVLEEFLIMLGAQDGEWLAYQAERRRG